MKNLFGILLAASLLTGTVLAAPSMAPSFESVDEVPEEAVFESIETEIEAEPSMPVLAPTFETTDEEATDERPSDILSGDALLMFDIYAGGDGSKDSPFEIENAAQLTYFAQMVNSGNDTECYYKLTADIDLGGVNWTPVGHYTADTLYNCSFKGSFDGNGHTVSNFTVTNAETRYIGFFGLMFNAEVKNLTLDNVTINADRTGTNATAAYAGALAGRVVTNGIGGKSTIENCHVTNSSVTLISDKDTFAGGLVGFALAGNNTEIKVFNVSSDANVSAKATATEWKGYNASTTPIPYTGASAGLFGYFGALTDSTISLRGAHCKGNVTIDSSSSEYVYSFAGGIVGQAATRITGEAGGVAYISSNHAEGDVTANSVLTAFTGGFAGNAGATRNMFISDCYASGNVSACATSINVAKHYSAIGGFVGQIDFDAYSNSMGKPLSSNYASGNVTDTYMPVAAKNDSYVGGFAGYSFAPLFANCYILESQAVSGRNTFTTDGILTVASDASSTVQGYPAFDFESVWTIDASAEYPYPTLRAINGVTTFYSEGKYFDETYFGESGKVTPPVSVPVKADTKEWDYTFSHWSLTEGGEMFDFNNTFVTEDTVFYAVFTSVKQKYEISFYSEGEKFGDSVHVEYGSKVSVPANTPQKPETQRYRYEFDYWSLSENGSEADFDTYTVTGKASFYAVFIEIDKTAWNGNVADSFSEGYGTATLPYVITSAEEFALLRKVINEGNSAYTKAYFELGADIHLGYNSWTPIGSEEYPFSAHLDGGGYSISCFKLENNEYMGLFGYVKSAEITNLYLSDFEVDVDSYTSTENVYVGGLAGYIHSADRINTVIDGVYVNAAQFDVKVSAPYVYAGNIAGYVNSRGAAKSLISNCYSTSDITVSNSNSSGITYAGGLAGYMYTYASTLSKASNCYYIGSVTAYGANKCCAGGLAGALYSYGSAYSPSYPSGSLTNEATDFDIMFENSFAIVNVSASSASNSKSSTYASAVAGEISQYAGINNIFYQRGTSIISKGTVSTYGTSASAANLESKSFLSSTVGLDFTNTWTYVGNNKYPVLKIMYSDKPILRLNNVEFEEGMLSANVTVFAKASYYTVIVGVYDERNRLIASSRTKFTSSEYANEFDLSFENLDSPYRVKVSAIDSRTFVPLFPAVEWYL